MSGSNLGTKGGEGALLVPLRLHFFVNETPENVKRNIRRTLETDYVPWNHLMVNSMKAMRHPMPTLSIVGFGPSLKKTWKKIEGDVFACNGAHNWLIEKGIVPKYGMFWDAHEKISQFVKPHKDVTYLVGSRCHKSVFEALEGYKVYVWHAKGDPGLQELLEEYNRMEPMLHGGSTSVLRALVLAVEMGYRNIKLFGADSSFTGDFTHVKKSIANEKVFQIVCNGRIFNTTTQLAGQAENFKDVLPQLRNQGCNIEVYGDGLFQEVAYLNGFSVHQSFKEFALNFPRRAKAFCKAWKQLPLTT